MRKITVIFTGLLVAFSQLSGQTSTTYHNQAGQEVTVSTPTEFKLTPPVRDWPTVERSGVKKEVRAPKRKTRTVTNPNALPQGGDPALQTEPGFRIAGPPLQSWKGLDGLTPPDPSGAAGPNHYVQAVNLDYAVYDKTGSMVAGPFGLSSLWNGTTDEGDPVVMYDRHADRWFISQFQDSPPRMLLAVSQSADPTGSYYAYSYQMSDFPDYPKFSIWWDGYYMTANASQTTVVFERDLMLAGNPNARMVALSTIDNSNLGFVSILPSDADGSLPPNGTPCYFFHFEDDAYGFPADRIIINEMTVDWTNINNTQVTQTQSIAPQVFDSDITDIPQPGTNDVLDAVPEVFYYRAPYMRWANHNSVVLCHVVDENGNGHAGLRWYELRDPGNGTWAIHQQGTYAPDAIHRWMGSIAMDDHGNIAMAYSVSGPNGVFPGLRYTGRLANDPLGTMTAGEQVGIAGGGSFDDFRYGDYSQLTLDPDGWTFWFTGEYVDGSSNTTTRIFSFQLATAAAVDDNPYYRDLKMALSRSGQNMEVNVSGMHNNAIVQLDLISLSGKVLSHQLVKPINRGLEHTFDMSTIAAGIYFVRVGNEKFQKVERFVITD